MKKWLTIQEASNYIGRSQRTIYRYLSSGNLKGYQNALRGKWIINVKDLDAFVMFGIPHSKLTRPQKEKVVG